MRHWARGSLLRLVAVLRALRPVKPAGFAAPGFLALTTVACAAGALCLVAGPAAAAERPDSTRREALQVACDAASQLRVTSARGVFIVRQLRIGPDDVALLSPPGRSALLVVGEPPAPERRIPWADLERLQSERSSTRRGALAGLVVGTVLGGLVLSHGPDYFEKGDRGAIALAACAVVGCTTIGLVLGLSSPHLSTLYP